MMEITARNAGRDTRCPESRLRQSLPEQVRDGTAELFFQDLFREPVGPALERPDPFAPEPHALDIAGPAWLDMVGQEFIKDPEF